MKSIFFIASLNKLALFQLIGSDRRFYGLTYSCAKREKERFVMALSIVAVLTIGFKSLHIHLLNEAVELDVS